MVRQDDRHKRSLDAIWDRLWWHLFVRIRARKPSTLRSSTAYQEDTRTCPANTTYLINGMELVLMF